MSSRNLLNLTEDKIERGSEIKKFPQILIIVVDNAEFVRCSIEPTVTLHSCDGKYSLAAIVSLGKDGAYDTKKFRGKHNPVTVTDSIFSISQFVRLMFCFNLIV